MFEDESNGFAQVVEAGFARLALAVGAWHFSAVGDVPGAVPFDDRRELVPHVLILAPDCEKRVRNQSTRGIDSLFGSMYYLNVYRVRGVVPCPE